MTDKLAEIRARLEADKYGRDWKMLPDDVDWLLSEVEEERRGRTYWQRQYIAECETSADFQAENTRLREAVKAAAEYLGPDLSMLMAAALADPGTQEEA